ncbi:PAP2 superfamily protein [Rivularia sp. PCC 7116]|uniref:vanadium-dependent haloperoxidase n=1 Tax=Rivularia sp. PCC 7116 TaxID=373994 RepID=UPI00029EE1AB|nr:vanadium-dependent haloperoxidase [Rivularia sp. PCC 7116]AFY57561.1 PAP2 superfamily protein [Rivularia sp. PCC 7116]
MKFANLAVDFGEVIQTPTIFPDEQGKVEVTITNQGNTNFNGPLNLKLYASTDNELDLKNLNKLDDVSTDQNDLLKGTDELLGTLKQNNIFLAPGESRTLIVDFAGSDFRTASVVSPGLYYLFAEVEPANNITDIDVSDNRSSTLITQGDAVIQWNSILLNTIQATGKNPADGTPPPIAARNQAIVHKAIYDAVLAAPTTSDEAAVVGAASQALIKLFPTQKSTIEGFLNQFLQAIPDSEAKTNGINIGQQAADLIVNQRATDGYNTAQVPFTPGNGIGDWQFTYRDGETTNSKEGDIDEALLPNWGLVTPFVLESGNQFRPFTFPQYNSPFYAQQLNQVQELGAENSTVRNAEQTEIAQFWAYDRSDSFKPPGQWNQIAQEVALDKGNSLEQNAELFAVLNTGLADAGITAWDAKYVYDEIRPITAIREADKDNHPNTIADPTWEPLLDTPPFPDYISGHSVFGGAASTILARFFGDETSFEIPSQELPGVSRSYGSFSQAAYENADSRLFGGVHINAANIDGVTVGQDVGNFVFDNFA